jgi:chromosome segregation ATPase
MVRHWRSDSTQYKPTYRSTTRTSAPNHSCSIHEINATATDRIVLNTLAQALTDPEQLLDLGDKADQQATQAAYEANRAETELEVYREMDAKREAEREKCLKAIESLSAFSGDKHRDMITELRAELAQLDQEQAKANEERQHTVPQFQRHLQRAQRRAQILERLHGRKISISAFSTRIVNLRGF